jgi:hypothetical protein
MLVKFLHAIKVQEKNKFYFSQFVNQINTMIDFKMTYVDNTVFLNKDKKMEIEIEDDIVTKSVLRKVILWVIKSQNVKLDTC